MTPKTSSPDREPTNMEILEAIHAFSNAVDQRFEDLETKFNKRFEKIESTMVTKDYLDEKLSDLRGDLVVMIRKEDRKVTTLVAVLQKKQVISREEAKDILQMEPFGVISSLSR